MTRLNFRFVAETPVFIVAPQFQPSSVTVAAFFSEGPALVFTFRKGNSSH
jgi:hypothetical protein